MNPKMTLLHEAFVSALCVKNTSWKNRGVMKLCISDNLYCSEIETRSYKKT